MILARRPRRLVLTLLLLLPRSVEMRLRFTRQEAESVSDGKGPRQQQQSSQQQQEQLFEPPVVEGHLMHFLGRTGIRPPQLGSFRINEAQSIATQFCRLVVEAEQRRRCTWSEYQAVVSRLLLPFDKSFNHGHMQGAVDEKTVQARGESIPLPLQQQQQQQQQSPRRKTEAATAGAGGRGGPSQPPEPLPCAELSQVPTAAEFQQLVEASRPFVVRGAVAHWPAVRKWTSAYLRSILPEMLQWPVAVTPHGHFDCVEGPEVWNVSTLPVVVERTAVRADGEQQQQQQEQEEVHVLVRPATVSLTTGALLAALGKSVDAHSRQVHDEHRPYLYVEYLALAMLQKLMGGQINGEAAFDRILADLEGAFDGDEAATAPAHGPPGRRPFDLAFASFLAPTHRLLWLGSGGTVGNLHFDRQENVMAVLRGAKTFTLYDPTQSSLLYMGTPLIEARFEATTKAREGSPLGASSPALLAARPSSLPPPGMLSQNPVRLSPYSPVNISDFYLHDYEFGDEVDGVASSSSSSSSSQSSRSPNRRSRPPRSPRSRFPRFAQAVPTQCRAEAGDLLYVPSRWWHEVTSEGDAEDDKTVAVNYWYRPWYHHLGFEEGNPTLIRNEHYSHLSGDFRSAVPCPHDERLVCWVEDEQVGSGGSGGGDERNLEAGGGDQEPKGSGGGGGGGGGPPSPPSSHGSAGPNGLDAQFLRDFLKQLK